ncbi:MAG: LamG domain-containing protein, partial [Bacteroidetes bacterium]|nr:LamG domain-containing protein [Bacteroidota bacterium]
MKKTLLLIACTFIVIKAQAQTNAAGEYIPDAQTVLLMHMNEGNGTMVYDASATSAVGMFAGGVTFGPGRFGSATVYANQGYFEVQHTPVLDLQDLTIEMWIYPTMPSFTMGPVEYNMALVSKRNSNAYQPYTFSIYNGGALNHNAHYVSAGHRDDITPAGILRLNEWQHVAVTRQFTGTDAILKFYVNGALVTESLVPYSAVTQNTLPLWVGKDPYYATYVPQGTYQGSIDELRLSNTAREPYEFNLQLAPTNLSASSGSPFGDLTWYNGGGAVPFHKYLIYRGTDSTSMAVIDSAFGEYYSDQTVT